MEIDKKIIISPSIVFLFLSILIGGYIRLSRVIGASFPLNDGGLFYTMTQNLIGNGFRIPAVTTYNSLNIPFAYPPLAFYLTGLLSKITGWGLFDIFRILPAVFSVLTIPAFYFFARVVLSDDHQVMLATLIFAITPATFDWLIMGGGVSRAPGFFFAILTLLFTYHLFTRKRILDIVLTAIFATITILFHPETALHTAASALVIFLFFGRNKAGILRSIFVASAILLLTSPWWITVLANHGFSPFLAAGKTGYHNISQFLNIFSFDLTNEGSLKSIAVLGLIGMFLYMGRKKYFLPVLFLAIYFAEPRSASLYESPLFAIFASFTLLQMLNLLNQYLRKKDMPDKSGHPFTSLASKALFMIFTGQWIFSALAIITLMFNTISMVPEDKSAFNWIVSNTPAESRFLVITGNTPYTDPVAEWLPALTERISIATVQGYEWLAKTDNIDVLQRSLEIQDCIDQSTQCLSNWEKRYSLDFDYLYIRKSASRFGLDREAFDSALKALLLKSDRYSLVYSNDQVVIFAKNG
jgi:hypothetical protein